MLIEFSVENYRVFRDRQTFSMVADPELSGDELGQTVDTGFTRVPLVHHQACIYGANGAGKTSLINAIRFLANFVQNAYRDTPSDIIDTAEFLFDSESLSKPSSYEIAFIQNNKLYQYGVSLTSERVLEEWLVARSRRNSKINKIFSRKSISGDDNRYEWFINNKYINNKDNFWVKEVKPTHSFLRTAVLYNIKCINEVYNWITKKLVFLTGEDQVSRCQSITAKLLRDSVWKPKIIVYMQKMGVRIDDIIVENCSGLETAKIKALPSEAKYEVFFVRLDENHRPVPIPIDEESLGVQSLFNLSGLLLQAIKSGCTILIDEVNVGLHPHVFREIITLFNKSQKKNTPSQLIYTTHDITVPSNKILSNDQIWFVNPSRKFSSSLYAYSDFKKKSDVSFVEDYLGGSLGAIPLIC